MRVAILGTQDGWHTAEVQAALARRGVTAPLLPVTRLEARLGPVDEPRMRAGDEPLDTYDVLLIRDVPGGSLEQIIYRMDALHRLENLGVRIVNAPGVIERTVDKYYTSSLLEDAGLPTPRTLVAEQFDQAMAGFHELGGDVVVKPIFGSEGRGMVRVTDPDTAYRVFRALEMGRYVYYLQEFIPHNQEDIRAFVIADRVVAAMVRRGDSWKTNVAQGAQTRPLALCPELEEMAVRAAEVLSADYTGVDILQREGGGYYVLEVNGIPGWRGLQSTTKINIADLLVERLFMGMC